MSVADTLAGPALFERQGHLVVGNLVPRPMTELLWAHAHRLLESGALKLGDRAVPGTPFAYGDPLLDRLLEQLRPRIEAAVGRRLHPTFSYLRMYKHGDVLRRHRDRPACEFSASLNIGQTPAGTWPLRLQGRTGPRAVDLRPGDALIYLGCELRHWRGAFEGERAAQAFLHYVDADGPSASQRFDGRSALGTPPAPGSGKRPRAPG
jgi:hypothetical protein